MYSQFLTNLFTPEIPNRKTQVRDCSKRHICHLPCVVLTRENVTSCWIRVISKISLLENTSFEVAPVKICFSFQATIKLDYSETDGPVQKMLRQETKAGFTRNASVSSLIPLKFNLTSELWKHYENPLPPYSHSVNQQRHSNLFYLFRAGTIFLIPVADIPYS